MNTPNRSICPRAHFLSLDVSFIVFFFYRKIICSTEEFQSENGLSHFESICPSDNKNKTKLYSNRPQNKCSVQWRTRKEIYWRTFCTNVEINHYKTVFTTNDKRICASVNQWRYFNSAKFKMSLNYLWLIVSKQNKERIFLSRMRAKKSRIMVIFSRLNLLILFPCACVVNSNRTEKNKIK